MYIMHNQAQNKPNTEDILASMYFHVHQHSIKTTNM
jgi:hypothetical protein